MSEFVAVDDTLRVIEHCLSIGRFDYNHVVVNLEAVVETAKLAKKYVDTDETSCTDGELARFAALETNVRRLSDAQVDGFDRLNALMFEHPFYQNLTNAVTLLTLYLADTVYDVTKPIVDDFQRLSMKEQPMSYATKLISNLKNEFTNPMKNFKNYADTNFGGFDRLNVLDGILAQLLFVEAYSNGFFFGGNMTNAKKMRDRIGDLRNELFPKWDREFLENDPLHAARFIVQTGASAGGYQIEDVTTNVVLIGSVGADVVDVVTSPAKKALRERLARLADDVKVLAERMAEKMDDEKEFLAQNGYYEQFVVNTRRLESLMRHAIADPSSQTIAEFQSGYTSSPITSIANNLIAMLQNPATNILRISMKADKFKSLDTFNKWADIITGLLAQLLFVECFKTRVLDGSKASSADELSFKIERLRRNLVVWQEEYKTSYWSSLVRELVLEKSNQGGNNNNHELSQMINESLAKVMTDDTLSTLVLDNVGVGDKRHYAQGSEEHMLTLDLGARTVIVGRSQRARSVNPQRIQQIRNQFTEYYDVVRQDDYSPFVTRLANCFGVGLVVMANERQNLGLAYTSEYPPAVMSALKTTDTAPDYFSLFIGFF